MRNHAHPPAAGAARVVTASTTVLGRGFRSPESYLLPERVRMAGRGQGADLSAHAGRDECNYRLANDSDCKLGLNASLI